MTESERREKIVNQAVAWLGKNEADGSHRRIIDLYNSHKPLARGYKLQYTDPWCAGFVSAVAIACGLTDCIPTEVGCSPMIALYQKQGRWQERDGYIPKPGDVIFYDWDDSGEGDNQNTPDHVGLVEQVQGDTVTVIEGNYQNRVQRRTLKVDGKYIRGYGLPDYGADTDKHCGVSVHTLQYGSRGDSVKAMQMLLTGWGFSCEPDGIFGIATRKALLSYQEDRNLTTDGICGSVTWTQLLGGV